MRDVKFGVQHKFVVTVSYLMVFNELANTSPRAFEYEVLQNTCVRTVQALECQLYSDMSDLH